MQYRHIYHAGNFADVFKHCILVMLIQYLRKKDKPIFYLDTHAGVGIYDLTSEESQKSREYERGIARLMRENIVSSDIASVALGGDVFLAGTASDNASSAKHDVPKQFHGKLSEVITEYLNIICAHNPKAPSINFLKFYKGSPCIIQAALRAQDHAALVELHPDAMKMLKHEFGGDQRIAIHHMDGYQSIKALLTPKQGRGLVLIDPPFEQENEFAQIIAALKIAQQRFPTGTYAVWYPIKEPAAVKKFYRELKAIAFKNILAAEFAVDKVMPDFPLASNGMIIINAPWQFDEQLKPLLKSLNKILAKSESAYSNVQWLVKPS